MPAKKKPEPSIFAPKQTSTKKSSMDTVSGSNIAKEIDQYVSLSHEIKDLEGKRELLKSSIMQVAGEVHGKRLSEGHHENFKLLGDESSISIIAQNSSSILSEEDLELARSESDHVDDLVELDYATIKLNNELFTKHAEKISKALTQALGREIAEQLFSAPGYKVKPDVLKQIAELGLDASEADTLVQSLKIKRYPKV